MRIHGRVTVLAAAITIAFSTMSSGSFGPTATAGPGGAGQGYWLPAPPRGPLALRGAPPFRTPRTCGPRAGARPGPGAAVGAGGAGPGTRAHARVTVPAAATPIASPTVGTGPSAPPAAAGPGGAGQGYWLVASDGGLFAFG